MTVKRTCVMVCLLTTLLDVFTITEAETCDLCNNQDDGIAVILTSSGINESSIEESSSKSNGQLDEVAQNEANLEISSQKIKASSKSIQKGAGCSPEFRTVVLPSGNVKVKYYPPCIRVWQCGGCCLATALSCQPTEATTIDVEVIVMEEKLRDIEGSVIPIFSRQKKTIPVQNHTKCECQCIQKKEDCGEQQDYREDLCRCVCKDTQAEEECNGNELRHWDSSKCSCEWRTVAQCSVQSYFDPKTESCQKIPNGQGDVIQP